MTAKKKTRTACGDPHPAQMLVDGQPASCQLPAGHDDELHLCEADGLTLQWHDLGQAPAADAPAADDIRTFEIGQLREEIAELEENDAPGERIDPLRARLDFLLSESEEA